MLRELGAELIGTFALVSAVCGAALFSAPSAGLIAVAFAVGLSVLAMAYAVGHISGGHFNPAVTCGLIAAGHFKAEKAIGYIVAQVIGGVAAAGVFYIILSGAPAGKWNITADRPVGFAPLAIGLALTMIHLVAIPISNASVNPARSTATAIFGGGIALSCLWLFWVAPIVGGVIGGLIARWLQTAPADE